jgi:hypothetical protein
MLHFVETRMCVSKHKISLPDHVSDHIELFFKPTEASKFAFWDIVLSLTGFIFYGSPYHINVTLRNLFSIKKSVNVMAI